MTEADKILAALPEEHRRFVRRQALAAPPVTEQQVSDIKALVTVARRRRAAQDRTSSLAA